MFPLKLHWSLFLKLASICLGNDLAPNMRQAITWTNADQVYRRIYAAVDGDGLIKRKSWEISFVNDIHLTCQVVLKVCAESLSYFAQNFETIWQL